MVVGDIHGLWKTLYNIIIEKISNDTKIDLLILLGDVEAYRSKEDVLSSESQDSRKERALSNELSEELNFSIKLFKERSIIFPILTIVIGGNHESSKWFNNLFYGGWLAENIFYTGYTNHFYLGNLLITSISGIYSSTEKNYFSNYIEPNNSYFSSKSYHIRAPTDLQLYCLKNTDIIITHDWPSNIIKLYSKIENSKMEYLLSRDLSGKFGYPNGLKNIHLLSPKYYFSGHNHVYFNTKIQNTNFIGYSTLENINEKCFEIFEFKEFQPGPLKISGKWLSILDATQKEMKNPKNLSKININPWENIILTKKFKFFEDLEINNIPLDEGLMNILLNPPYNLNKISE